VTPPGFWQRLAQMLDDYLVDRADTAAKVKFRQRPDPRVLSASIPLFFIGRNKYGSWVARGGRAGRRHLPDEAVHPALRSKEQRAGRVRDDVCQRAL
jgi:hypothetical protein